MAVTKMTLRLNEEDTKRLDELIEKRKYRVSRSEAFRFLIQDSLEEDKKTETWKAIIAGGTCLPVDPQ